MANDIGTNGKIGSLFIAGKRGKRDNSIVDPWDEKGYEINRLAMTIPVTNEKGLVEHTFVVSEAGKTINLYTDQRPSGYPNWASELGKMFMADDIADNMTLGKSMRNTFVGLLVGIALGWFVFAPMFAQVMS